MPENETTPNETMPDNETPTTPAAAPAKKKRQPRVKDRSIEELQNVASTKMTDSEKNQYIRHPSKHFRLGKCTARRQIDRGRISHCRFGRH